MGLRTPWYSVAPVSSSGTAARAPRLVARLLTWLLAPASWVLLSAFARGPFCGGSRKR
jgi:hypothetical protein